MAASAGMEMENLTAADSAQSRQAQNPAWRLFGGERLAGGGSGLRTVLCDGAMGSMLYGRGVFINRCYDELNLKEPELVRAVHMEYLQAGSEVLETNTFGANRIRLARFGLEARVDDINRAGVRLARECAEQMRHKLAFEAFVAGAMGPLGVKLGDGPGCVSEEDARRAFTEQASALAAGGPGVGADLLVMETMTDMREAGLALQAVAAAATGLPVIVMVTVHDDGNCLDGTSPEDAARLLEAAGANAVGCNCSEGPAIVLATLERMRTATELPLAAMPNAGSPRAVDGRSLYLTSPEYLASFARRFVKAGATFVGGCCGTTPQHIRAVRGALRALDAQTAGVAEVESAAAERPERKGRIEPPPLAERSKIGAMIAAGQFCTMVEIVPPKGFDCAKELEGAEELHKLGVDAINVPDSPRASARMSAMSLCVQIQQRVGIETVLHYTCRDRNLLSIQGDLLGAASIGLKNILCLTGDPPKMGTYPDATAVFDVDAIGLTRIARDLNQGLDLGGNPIGGSTAFALCVAANPGVPDLDFEVRRFAAKVEAGGEFAITQPVFDLGLLEDFLRRIEGFRIPVVAGIWPLTSVKNAEFMRDQLKVRMPEKILARMGRAASPEAARAEGILIAQEMLAEVRGMVQGVQVSAPFGKYKAAAQVLGFARG
jgi:methionine synthase I (cobalamin-dependent)/5,10-methylenetetrahydrofolate reductase